MKKRKIKRTDIKQVVFNAELGQMLFEFKWFSLFIIIDAKTSHTWHDITYAMLLTLFPDLWASLCVCVNKLTQITNLIQFIRISKRRNGKKVHSLQNPFDVNHMYAWHLGCVLALDRLHQFIIISTAVWISCNNFQCAQRNKPSGQTKNAREIIKKNTRTHTQESLWCEFFVVCFIVTAFYTTNGINATHNVCGFSFTHSFASHSTFFLFYFFHNSIAKVYLAPTYLRITKQMHSYMRL